MPGGPVGGSPGAASPRSSEFSTQGDFSAQITPKNVWEIRLGRLHQVYWNPRDADDPAGFTEATDAVSIAEVPFGDRDNPQSYLETLTSWDDVAALTREQAKSELLFAIVIFRNVDQFGTVTRRWKKPNGATAHTVRQQIPENERGWLWYALGHWIGRFTGEIDMTGTYRWEVDAPFMSDSATIEVLGPEIASCSPPEPSYTPSEPIEVTENLVGGTPGINGEIRWRRRVIGGRDEFLTVEPVTLPRNEGSVTVSRTPDEIGLDTGSSRLLSYFSFSDALRL